MTRPQINSRCSSPPEISPEVRKRVGAIARQAARILRKELGARTKVIWFGSWIEGNPAPRSDLDIAIQAPRRLDGAALEFLRERIESIPTLYQVDLVDLDRMGTGFRRRVLERGKRL